MKIILIVLFTIFQFSFSTLWAQDVPPDFDYLTQINCRIGERVDNGLVIINESYLDTTSKDPGAFSFSTNIHGGKKITTYLQHVFIDLPRDRFLVTLKLDDSILLRISHLDLDIYLEQVIDGHRYFLHCMPPIVLPSF